MQPRSRGAARRLARPGTGSDHSVPLIERVRRLIGETAHDFHECRQCGTTLEPAADRCDVCGSEEIVRYVIE